MEYTPSPCFFGGRGFFGGEPALGIFAKGFWGVFDRAFLSYFSPSDGEMIDFALCLCYNFFMRKYKYVLFDLDGTLVYSHPGIFACFRYALERMGRDNPTDRELLPCIGPSLHYSFQNFFGMTEEEAVQATALYRERYAVKGVWENTPIPGALECLKTLKEGGYVLGLATSKPILYGQQIVDQHGFSNHLTACVGSGMDGSLPTKASVIEEVMKRLGASADECLMVGDRFHDAEGAAQQGVDCALLKIGGYADEEELYSSGAKYVFADFTELTAFLFAD